MSDFNWEDHPVAKDASFDWDSFAKDDSDSPSELDSAGRGAIQGATFGLRDEAAGALENPFGAAKEIANKFGVGYADADVSDYKRERDASRALDEAAKQANPKSYLAGELGGGIATQFIPGVGVAKDADLLKTMLTTGAQGAAYGLGGSDAEDAKHLALDAIRSGATGVIAGGAGHAIGQGVASALAPEAADVAEVAPQGLQKQPNNFFLNDIIDRQNGEPLSSLPNGLSSTPEVAPPIEATQPGVLSRTTSVLKKTIPQDIGTLAKYVPGGHTAKGLINEFAMPTIKKAASITTDTLTDLATKSPEALGKFSQVFQQAVQRGPQAVAATHFILEQTNPEYREHMTSLTSNGAR